MRRLRFAMLLLCAPWFTYVSLAPVTPAAAAVAATCRGEVATIVGDRFNQLLYGTEARDVIVTGGARYVEGRGGDDLICLTDGRANGNYTVLAGSGADDVHLDTQVVSDDNGSLPYSVVLDDPDAVDEGVDTFTGARAGVLVASDGGADVIDTGAGPATVFLDPPGAPFDGEVQMPGGGSLRLQGPVSSGAVIGSGSPSSISLEYDDAGPWAVDAGARTASRAGVPALRWTGPFTGFAWTSNPVSFVGTAVDEFLSGDRIRTAAMGGGDDTVVLESDLRPTSIDGGTGTDEVRLDARGSRTSSGFDEVMLDLGLGRLVLDEQPPVPAIGFEDAYVDLGGKVTVIGDDGPNDLSALGCQLRILGRGGDDRLTNWSDPEEYPGCGSRARIEGGAGDDRLWGGLRGDVLLGGPGDDEFGASGPMTVLGGAGDDRAFAALYARRTGSVLKGQAGDDLLVGRRADDRLVGGPGRDAARGNGGRDFCRAEMRSGCER